MALRRFRQSLGYGRFTATVAYVEDASKLPLAVPGAEWQEDPTFALNAESRAKGFHYIVDAVRRNGYALVTKRGEAEKPGG